MSHKITATGLAAEVARTSFALPEADWNEHPCSHHGHYGSVCPGTAENEVKQPRTGRATWGPRGGRLCPALDLRSPPVARQGHGPRRRNSVRQLRSRRGLITMDIDSNVIERAAEAACQAWMKTDLGIMMPDRSPADLPLDSKEWCDFWQGLGIKRRDVFRAQAEAVLRSTGAPVADQDAVDDGELSPLALAAVPEIAAWLEKTAPGLRYKTARDGLAVASVLLKREVTGEV